MVRTGDLKHKIELRRNVAAVASADDYGGIAADWKTIAQPWAKIETPGGREALSADQVQGELTHLVTIRFLSEVTCRDQIRFTDRTGRQRTLGIASVADANNAGRFLELRCIEQIENE